MGKGKKGGSRVSEEAILNLNTLGPATLAATL